MKTRYGSPRFSILALLIVVGLLCASLPGALHAADPEYGGTLRFVGEVDALGFDAIKARSMAAAGRRVGNLVMDASVRNRLEQLRKSVARAA